MTSRLLVFHVILSTSLDQPWEADVYARSVHDAFTQAVQRSGSDPDALTHVLVRRVSDADHA